MQNGSGRFIDPQTTEAGEPRAAVGFGGLQTLWFNTGTLCNLTCANCYIESSPENDRLVYLTLGEVRGYLEEIARDGLPTREIGLTGGEPFMNPEIVPIIETALARGFAVLVLTNAMRPMMKHQDALLRLRDAYGARLTLRVSIDHYERRRHEEERGPRAWAPALAGLQWLSREGFSVHVAARSRWGDTEASLRDGFAALFAAEGIRIDARSPRELVLFPEMDEAAPVPEITTACWGILGVDPADMMCASSRMVVKRKGEAAPSVMACTLLPYDARFDLGRTLAEASVVVPLNHPHCARFCVLGGGACSVGG
jgi:uncharacterized Fe-S cluster-containing radical SAM superfamily protein